MSEPFVKFSIRSERPNSLSDSKSDLLQQIHFEALMIESIDTVVVNPIAVALFKPTLPVSGKAAFRFEKNFVTLGRSSKSSSLIPKLPNRLKPIPEKDMPKWATHAASVLV